MTSWDHDARRSESEFQTNPSSSPFDRSLPDGLWQFAIRAERHLDSRNFLSLHGRLFVFPRHRLDRHLPGQGGREEARNRTHSNAQLRSIDHLGPKSTLKRSLSNWLITCCRTGSRCCYSVRTSNIPSREPRICPQTAALGNKQTIWSRSSGCLLLDDVPSQRNQKHSLVQPKNLLFKFVQLTLHCVKHPRTARSLSYCFEIFIYTSQSFWSSFFIS